MNLPEALTENGIPSLIIGKFVIGISEALHGTVEHVMDDDAKILKVGVQGDEVVFWAEIRNPEYAKQNEELKLNISKHQRKRTFTIFGTGHPLPQIKHKDLERLRSSSMGESRRELIDQLQNLPSLNYLDSVQMKDENGKEFVWHVYEVYASEGYNGGR